jgi:hypothetical protein
LSESPSAWDRAQGRFLDLLVWAFLIGITIRGVVWVIAWLHEKFVVP